MPTHQYGTVTQALEALARRGYTANFEYLDGAFIDVDSGRAFSAEELTIVDHYRFEGASDPEDMAVVYAIASQDGVRGVVVDAFGVYASPPLGEFLNQVRQQEDT